ncbi:hypothetical protein [Fibrella forsythiae]|uniref:Uncharacterized protein n=1 Tax=Fibrella forsythiae TaxID=2817061 RepID=A0ABS3JM13_9BACT|nr:hypothetical protein [Fibrella forsythiae]MBO0951052.1 hypothetical protein [Fibrella forsythiae]
MPSSNPSINQIRAFLTQIGIPTRQQELPGPTFLPGLLIQDGELLFDPARLAYPGDMLHEAGHIAVSAPAERQRLSGDITDQKPEKAGEELAVLLWSYAACLHLDLDLRVVFHPAGYSGQSEWLIEQFTAGNYVGLPLLVWMGLAQPPQQTGAGFPTMIHWVRP